MSKIIGQFKMLPLEDGVTPKDIKDLVSHFQDTDELIPLSNTESDLEANSVAMGFLLNDYYESRESVLNVLTSVCNDWDLETHNQLYEIDKDTSIHLYYDNGNKLENIIIDIELGDNSQNDKE